LKVLFISGSLESGNGGADYTKELASVFCKQGVEIALLSLYDSNKEDLRESENLSVDINNFECQVLRISKQQSQQIRIKKADVFITDFEPDIISLQYGPYAFQKKGIPFNLIYVLNKINRAYQWHIMFHEIWIGTNHSLNIKDLIIRNVQRFIVKILIRLLKVSFTTTSIPLYRDLLNAYHTKISPVFGNIPISKTGERGRADLNDTLQVVHFGSFTSELDLFTKQLKLIKKIGGTYPKSRKVFIIMGNGGPYKAAAVNLIYSYLEGFSIVDEGLLPAEKISEILLKSHLGLSRADLNMLGKSGSSIAMLEHGLPIIIKGNKSPNENEFLDLRYSEQLIFLDDTHIDLKFRKPKQLVQEVALDLLSHYRTMA